MHSPWGLEWSIIKETGWTRRYLLWGESWLNISMMLADGPTFKRVKKQPPEATSDDIAKFLSI